MIVFCWSVCLTDLVQCGAAVCLCLLAAWRDSNSRLPSVLSLLFSVLSAEGGGDEKKKGTSHVQNVLETERPRDWQSLFVFAKA